MSSASAQNNNKSLVGKMARGVRPMLSSSEGEGITEKLYSNTGGAKWRSHLNLFGLCHKHDNGTPCTNHLEHSCIDSGMQELLFVAAAKELVDHFQAPLQETIDTLKQRISDLEKELAAAKRAGPSKTAGTKQKMVDSSSDHMEIDRAPPAKRTTPSSEPAIPILGFDSPINSNFRPNKFVDYVLMHNSDFQASFPLSSAMLHWSFEHSTIHPMAATLVAINQNVEPNIIPITGTPAGDQTFPRNSTELSFALRLCILQWLAGLLNYLHSKSPSTISVLVGVGKDCLSINIYPQWAQFTTFIDPAVYSHTDDSPDTWSQAAPEVPAISSDPAATATDEEFTNAVFVHYSHSKHCGIMMNDDGPFYMLTISAYQFHLTLAPPRVQGKKDFASDYCLVVVKMCANYGHYPFLIATNNLTVSSDRNLSPCKQSDVKDCREFAKHLAHFGVTPAELEGYYAWEIKYCLDIQHLTYLPMKLRCQYANIFISAQHCLMFIPISLPSDNTYVVPQHWKHDDILWKAKENPNSPFNSSEFTMPIIRPAASSGSDTAILGMAAAMNIDAAPSGSSDQSNNRST
ncbi:hypothetical protein L218DRAFT_1008482 [Marasmius fiardii PR-910]|nr:hypothetical protein L218DRAFT_1008482 [Marasmius fiardii PR-910]